MIDQAIVVIVRGVAMIVGVTANLAIRAGERITAQSRSGNAKTSTTPGYPSNGGPARTGVAATAVIQRPAATVQRVALTPPTAAPPSVTAPIGFAQASDAMADADHAPDELDWAGSLSHAAVASLHLGHVLAMVRAGWLVPDMDRMADVSAALDAMEAFQDRTATVIAPVLDALTDEQQAEFFGDFGDDFPPDLPDLEDVP